MYTIDRNSSNEYKIRGSTFISFIQEVSNLNDVKKEIAKFNNQYPDATHVCYGYRICNTNSLDLFNNPDIIEYSSDDGEPKGTAGIHIVNSLCKESIINAIILVIRYFGGTKLGIPGLINSYKISSEEVINKINLCRFILYKKININFDYKLSKTISLIIKNNNCVITNKFI